MPRPPALRRRDLLGSLPVLGLPVLGLAVPSAARAGIPAGPDPDGALPRALLALLDDRRASAARVGRAYLAGAGARERDPGALTRLIVAEAPGLERAALRRRCALDFARGRTVRLDGWVLAASEARLCALHALAG